MKKNGLIICSIHFFYVSLRIETKNIFMAEIFNMLSYLIPLENWNVTDWIDDTHFYLKSNSNILYACVVAPHSGNDFHWLLRVANVKTFDKWIYAEYEQYFSDPNQLISELEKFDTRNQIKEKDYE